MTIFLLMISFTNSRAQVTKGTLLADQYYKKADSLYIRYEFENSRNVFEKALPIYQEAKAWEKVASCYNKISECQSEKRKYEASLSTAHKALEIVGTYLNKDNLEKANAYDNIGRSYTEYKHEFNTGLEYHNKALQLRQRVDKNHPDISNTYRRISSCYFYMGDTKTAIEYSKKSLSIRIKYYGPNHVKTADSYLNMAIVFNRLGEFDTATKYLKKNQTILIKEFGNHQKLAYSYTTLGAVYNYTMRYDSALEYFEKASDIYDQIRQRGRIEYLYAYKGLTYMNMGAYDDALEYLKKGLRYIQKLFGKKNVYILSAYKSIGIIYSLKGDLDKAQEYLEKAISSSIDIYGEDYTTQSLLYNNLGVIYKNKKMYDKALKCYNKALLISNNNQVNKSQEIAESYKNIGIVYYEKKKYDKALNHLKKSITTNRKLSIDISSPLDNHYNLMGNIFAEQGNYQNALLYYEKALISNLKSGNPITSIKKFDFHQYLDPNLLLATLKNRAKMLQLSYQKTGIKKKLEASIQDYQNADVMIDTIRQSLHNYEDKITFSKTSQEVYTGAINAQLLLHHTQPDQQWLSKSFYYAEKSKANTLNELLTDAKAKKFADLPTPLLKLERELKANRAFYQSQITTELSNKVSDTSKIWSYENKLFDISQRQDSLFSILKKQYPKYFSLKHQNKVVTVSEIQQNLSKNTTLLEFFTTDSILYAFTISKNNITVKEIKSSNLSEKIDQFNKAIVSKNMEDFTKKSYSLYKKLIDPIANKLAGDELIIIADGALWHLNFELLLTQNDPSKSIKNLPFLLKDYAITYANSATLLFKPLEQDKRNSKLLKECLAFSFSDSANVSDGKTMSLFALRNSDIDLPGTRKEINAIANIVNGEYYYGNQAVESNFKKNANKYNIIHLALHGEVDNNNPENSKLYFTKRKDSIEDNLLYAHELFAIDIPAELTVLSACNTGSGKIAKGEGIMSLGNAFQYAGTKSLLLTGWEVYDETTPKLMEYFYRNLKEGMNKSKALQRAKLTYLNTSDNYLAAPVYWGAFYLVGDTRPIQFEDNHLRYWVIGLVTIGILLLLGILVYKNKLKNQ